MRWGFHIENLYGVRVRPKECLYDDASLAASDAWALKRCEELKAQGIEAKTIRTRKREPLCVVYKLAPEASKTVC